MAFNETHREKKWMENVKYHLWVLKVHIYEIMKSILVKKTVTHSCDSKWVEKTFIWFNTQWMFWKKR